jgi:hypothetical protein
MTQKKKENELDPNTQLEKLPFAASIDAALRFPEADIGNGAQHFGEPMAATRTKGEFAAIAPMTASRKLALPKPRSVRFIKLWYSIIGNRRIGTNQHAYTDYFWHFVHKTKSQWASSILESHSACSVCLVRSPAHSKHRILRPSGDTKSGMNTHQMHLSQAANLS